MITSSLDGSTTYGLQNQGHMKTNKIISVTKIKNILLFKVLYENVPNRSTKSLWMCCCSYYPSLRQLQLNQSISKQIHLCYVRMARWYFCMYVHHSDFLSQIGVVHSKQK